jgi:hypothetical protein
MSITRIQLRGDIAANWTSANPVLAEREIGLETDTNKFKVGNGSTAWNALDYYIEPIALTGGTNINITNDYEINLDSSINLTSLSASTIYSGSTNINDIFASGTIPTTYPYDLIVAASDETTAITTGTSKVTFYAPAAFTLTGVTASLTTTGSTTTTIDVNYNGSSVFATPISLASGIYYATTATTTTSIARYGRFTVDFDAAGTGAAGVKVTLEGSRNL